MAVLVGHQPPMWQLVRENLRQRIAAGLLKPGDKIPSTRELATEFETSTLTVRRAVESMIERDELIGRQGLGVFVAGSGAASQPTED